MNIKNVKFIGVVLSACVLSAQADVVVFKDAAKINSQGREDAQGAWA